MNFAETKFSGVFLLEPERFADERGTFSRFYCREAFLARGLNADVAQSSLSSNRRRGTLRGMHWQAAPHGETKLIGCVRGAVYDVLLDLRAGSATLGQWMAQELCEADGRLLYVPQGIAHGFQSLRDDTVVSYQLSTAYVATHARGIRWDDPAFDIRWPIENPILSPRDREHPNHSLKSAA